MLDIQQKRKIRGIMYHKVTLVALGIFVLLAMHSTWSVYTKKRESEKMKNISSEHLNELKQRDEDLKEKITRIDTSSGLEEEIRAKFSVVKDNENMVVIVPDNKSVASTTEADTGFWSKMRNFFFR